MAPRDVAVTESAKSKENVDGLANENTEPQGAQTEYSKAKYHRGEITLQEFLLPDDESIATPAFDNGEITVPIIDLQQPQKAAELVRAAESGSGCFLVTNHEVAMDVVQRLEGHLRRFFELPMDTKLTMRRGATSGMCGFVAGSPMCLASRWWAESLQLDWNETRMHNVLRATLPSHTEFHNFRVDYMAYMKGVGELSHKMLQLLAEGLGLPSTAFTTQVLGACRTTGSATAGSGDMEEEEMKGGSMRFNYYATCPRPEKVWGLVAHQDPSVLSIMHQDAVPGLQVRTADGQWLGVAPVPFSFVVLVGDMLKVMSNGRFESSLHCVVTNSSKPRLSMAYFCIPQDDTVISAAPELLNLPTHQPAQLLYRPFTYVEYSRLPFQPGDFTSLHEYRPQRVDYFYNNAIMDPASENYMSQI